MTQIKGMIFDKDGTLFDFAATWEAWANAFLERLAVGDLEKKASLAAEIGFDLQNCRFAPTSVVIAGTPFEVAEALAPHFSRLSTLDLVEVLNDEAEKAPQQPAVPLEPFLDNLRRMGLKLGVATNDAEAPARAHLAQAGVTEKFDFIAGYDSGFGGKPAPGQLMAFLEQEGLAANEVVMVGDSTHDLRAGRAAGMMTVGVLTGIATEPQLGSCADIVFPDIGHIPNWLKSLP